MDSYICIQKRSEIRNLDKRKRTYLRCKRINEIEKLYEIIEPFP